MASPIRDVSPTGLTNSNEESLPIDVFLNTPVDKEGGHTSSIFIEIGLSGSNFSLQLNDVPATECQHYLRKFLDSLDKSLPRKERKRRSRQKAKSPESSTSRSSSRHAKSPERAGSTLERTSRAEHPRGTAGARAASPPARAASPVRLEANDPTQTCRPLEDMMARNKNRSLNIPYSLDECFKFLMRSALRTRGLFLEQLSSKSQLAFDRYLRIVYRGQSINSIDEATRTHYEEPNLIAHIILRVFRELPKPLLSQSDVEHLTNSAIGAHLQTAAQVFFSSGTHESRLLFAFLQLLWSLRANKRANGIAARRLASVIAPSLVRRGDISNVLYLLIRHGQNYLYQTTLQSLDAHAKHFSALTSRYPELAKLLLQTDMALFRVMTDVIEPSLASTMAPSVVRFLKSNSCAVIFLARLIAKELAENNSPSTYFRSNNLATQLLSLYCKEEGRRFLDETLAPLLQQLCKVDGSFEVKPSPGVSEADIAENQQRLHAYLALFFNMIVTALGDLPDRYSPGIGQIAYQMQSLVNEQGNKDLLVGSFIFLRFLCPAIVSPEGFDLIEAGHVKPHIRNGLVSISKVLQNMANRTKLKEAHMQFLQPFVDENLPHLSSAFGLLSIYGETHPITETLPQLPTADFETCLIVHQYLAENLAEVDELVREMKSPEVVRTFKEVQMLLCEMPSPPPIGSELGELFQSLPCPELRVKVFSQSALATVAFHFDNNGQTYWSADAEGRTIRHAPNAAGTLQTVKTGFNFMSCFTVSSTDILWIAGATGLTLWNLATSEIVQQPITNEACSSIVASTSTIYVGGVGQVSVFPSIGVPSGAPRTISLPARNTTGPDDDAQIRKLVFDQFGCVWALQTHGVHIVDPAKLAKKAHIPLAPSVEAAFLLPVGESQMWVVCSNGLIILFDSQTYQMLRETSLDFLGSARVSAARALGSFALIGLDDGRLAMMDTQLLTVSKNVPHVLTVPVIEIHPIWNATQQHWELWTWSADGSYCCWIPYSQSTLSRPAVDYVPVPTKLGDSQASASSSAASGSSSSAASSVAALESVRITIQYKITDPRNPLTSQMKSVQLNISPKKTVKDLVVGFIQQLHMQGKKDFQEVLLLDSECTELADTDVLFNVWKKGETFTADLF